MYNNKTHDYKRAFLALLLFCLLILPMTRKTTYASGTDVTINYNVNGGVGTNQVKTVSENSSTLIEWPANLEITPQTGFHFTSWNTASDGSGTSYNPSDTYVATTDLTLYAQWSNTNSAPFTAKLYDSNAYSSYTELSESGAIGNPWNFSYPTRYLIIDVDFSGFNGGSISIILPTGMALYDNNYTKMAGHPQMTNEPVFTIYDEDPQTNGYQQGTGAYSNQKTGTLTYTFSTAATTDRLIIPITFDQRIWDRSTELANLSGDKVPITVIMDPNNGTNYMKVLSRILSSNGTGPYFYSDYWPKKVLISDSDPFCMNYSSVRDSNTYWRSLIIEYTLPHDTQNNYAEYTGEPTNDGTITGTTNANINYTRPQAVDSTSSSEKIVYTWTDYLNSSILFISPVMRFPSSKFSDGETLSFSLKLTGITYTGSLITKNINCTTEATILKPDVQISSPSKQVYPSNMYSNNVNNILGSMSLRNTGLLISNKLEVTFDFDINNTINSGNHGIEVTAVSLPQTNTNTPFNISCTLVDINNSNSITYVITNVTKTYDSQLGHLLLARDVVNAYNIVNNDNLDLDSWFFKKIIYEIPYIETNVTLYRTTAQLAFAGDIPSGGNYYGRIISTSYSRLTVKEWDNLTDDWGVTKTATCHTSLATKPDIPLYIGNIQIDNQNTSKTITAGDSLILTMSLLTHNYPYGNTQYSANPVVYFVAPPGVTLPVNGISAVWSDGSQDTINPTITTRNLSSGDTLYIIEFSGTAKFGAPVMINGKLTVIEQTRHPIIIATINTAAGMDTSNLLLKNNFFIFEDNGNIINTPPLYTKDVLDLNNNDITTENIGRISSDSTLSVTIVPNTNQLTFSAHAKLSNEPDSSYRSGIETTNRLYLSDVSENVNYRLTIQNTSGSIVPSGNFIYYIPIPGSNIQDYHKLNGIPEFNLTLTGAVVITGNNSSVYDLRYSTDANGTNYSNNEANFESTGGYASWLTADQVTDWSDVTMIKIIGVDPINGYIPTGTEDNFVLTLAYSGNILTDAGKTTSWGSCGVQKYREDGTFNDDGTHTPTAFVTVMLRSEVNYSVVLTAASNMTPTSPAVKMQDIDLPSYTLAESLSILSISTTNVVLHQSSVVTGGASTATGVTANGCFGITTALDGGNAYELSNGINQVIGSTTPGSSSKLRLQLYNYDALSDISTPREVVLVLGDNNGIQITINITIARERAAVSQVNVHIESGKVYQLMHGNADSVTITRDSAFTVQYIRTYIPNNYIANTLSLSLNNVSVSFPIGTKLILIDLTIGTSPYYYYYTVGTDSSSIALSSFISMMNGTTSYIDPAAGTSQDQINDETLLLVTDFSDVTTPLEVGNYSLSLSLTGTTPSVISRTVTLTTKREFTLTSSTSTPTANNTITITGTASTTNGSTTDSRWLYRKMALVVSLKNNTNVTVPFPDGIIITMGGINYIPSGNIVILPLGSLGTYDYSYTIATPHTQITAGNYTISTSLYVSSTASAESPMGGDLLDTKDVSITVLQKPLYALSITSTDQNQLIELPNENTVTLNLNILYNLDAASAAITLEIQEKVTNTYLTSDEIIVSASADGISYIVNGYGIIQFPTRSYDDGILQVALILNKNELTVGNTYRIYVKAVGSGDVVDDMLNFIVID